MKRLYTLFPILITTVLLFSILVLSGCIEPSPYCPSRVYVDLSKADSYASNPNKPFCFPLDDISQIQSRTGFAAYGYTNPPSSSKEYHTAEDYDQIPGTPVYAMADGIVSLTGPRGGYGWLVIIEPL
ncbi:MAG: M23 family metallopeptidase [Dehalococcoidia bacterium]|nr:MAG: M23 family metallopeptidase [Dehalococcoidia bacterium]